MRKLGYELLIACHGVEALEMLQREAKKGPSHEIECILMDATMDVMDGLECTRVIRAQQLPHRTRPFIIAQTANVTAEFREGCLASGMDAFLSKPINLEDLQRALIVAYLSHHPVHHPTHHTANQRQPQGHMHHSLAAIPGLVAAAAAAASASASASTIATTAI